MSLLKSSPLFAVVIYLVTGCTKEGPIEMRQPTTPIGFNYTFPAFPVQSTPTKKLKIKVLDTEARTNVKGAVYYIKAVGRKLNCTGITGCDSTLYEDSVVTDANGEAMITKRGSIESLRAVKGYWELPHLSQTFSFIDYDSTVIRLWPEVWVKVQVKNVIRYDDGYLFSPKLLCSGLGFAYQSLITINKDTTFTERLWANQNYKISLNLYKNQQGTLNGSPAQVLKEFDQFMGRDTVQLVLSY